MMHILQVNQYMAADIFKYFEGITWIIVQCITIYHVDFERYASENVINYQDKFMSYRCDPNPNVWRG